MEIQKLPFVKYSNIGNDMIILNKMTNHLDTFLADPDIYRALLDRPMGVGADAFLAVKQDPNPKYAYRVEVYNKNGRADYISGNGMLSVIKYMVSEGHVLADEPFEFTADDGIHVGEYNQITGEAKCSFIPVPVKVIDDNTFFVPIGIAHLIVFQKDNDHGTDLQTKAKELSTKFDYLAKENSFATKVLVNFVNIKDGACHPRGFHLDNTNENCEIIACGSGSAAIALAYAVKEASQGKRESERVVNIRWSRGTTTVSFKHGAGNAFSCMAIRGKPTFVFEGQYNMQQPQGI